MNKKKFNNLYLPKWHNALCKDRKKSDVLGVAAYDGEKQIALAGASADCEKMRQIGVDVLPEYRKRELRLKSLQNLHLKFLNVVKFRFIVQHSQTFVRQEQQ